MIELNSYMPYSFSEASESVDSLSVEISSSGTATNGKITNLCCPTVFLPFALAFSRRSVLYSAWTSLCLFFRAFSASLRSSSALSPKATSFVSRRPSVVTVEFVKRLWIFYVGSSLPCRVHMSVDYCDCMVEIQSDQSTVISY